MAPLLLMQTTSIICSIFCGMDNLSSIGGLGES